MQETTPTHLINTYQLLQCAFSQGIEEQEYLPLLSVIHKQMSDRGLAQVVAEFTGREYAAVLNDVYRVGMAEGSFAIAEVKQKLIRCGYEEWLIEG